MSQDSALVSERDRRLEQVLAEYFRSLEAGQPLDEEKLLAEQPDLAEDLRSFFRNLSAVEKLAKPLIAAADTSTIGLGAAAPAEDGKLIRYFGDYELLEEIARGGMGVVYKARQRSLGRLVALKMILAGQLASPADVQRFRQEAEAAANLDHPGIVPIFEIGEHEGQHYFSMKLIEGGSLRDRFVGVPPSGGMHFDQSAAAQLMAAIARAVHHAHQRGVLHRDLKPGNILLDADGQPHVTDFGLAKRVEGGSDLTQSGAIVGTPAYMAPEQSLAKKQLTTAADIYSLGAILYELLTGRPPFEGDSPGEVLIAVINDEPKPPRSLNPAIDRDLDMICLKCLEKDPQRRYDSAAALAGDLDRWLADEPILARPDPFSMRIARLIRRYRVWFQAAAASLAFLLTGLLAALFLINGAKNDALVAKKDALELAEQKSQLATKNLELARSESQARNDVQRQSAALNRALFEYAVSERSGGRSDRAIAILASVHAAAAENEPLRRTSANMMAAWLETAPVVLSGHIVPGFRGDGQQAILIEHEGAEAPAAAKKQDRSAGPPNNLTVSEPNCELELRDLRSGKAIIERKPFPFDRRILAAGKRADGRIVVIAGGSGTARIWDLMSGKPIGAAITCRGSAAALSADGTTALTGLSDKSYQLWDARTGASIGRLIEHGGSISGVAFSADGTTVLTVSEDRTARLWNARDGAPIGEPMAHGAPVQVGTFSHDGRKVVTLSEDGSARLWDARTGRPLGNSLQQTREESALSGSPLEIVRPGFTALAFSPDSKTVATGSGDGFVQLWDTHSGKSIEPPMKCEAQVNAVAFSPDGTIVFAAVAGWSELHRGEVVIFDAHSGHPVSKLTQFDAPVTNVVCSEDGATLITEDLSQGVSLWDMTSGKPIAPAMPHPQPISALAYSPDGQTLLTGSEDATARLWDMRNGKSVGQPMTHSHPVHYVAWSRDGMTVITGSGDYDSQTNGEARIWNARSGKPVGPPIKHENPVVRAELSSDGAILVTFSRRATVNGETLETQKLLGEHPPVVQLWDAASGKRVAEPIVHDGGIVAMDFDPRQMVVATGSYSGIAQLWDARTGKPVGEPMKHGRVAATGFSSHPTAAPNGAAPRPDVSDWVAERITAMAFSRDGRMLFTVSEVESSNIRAMATRLWDVQTRKLTRQSIDQDMGLDDAPDRALFSADGRTAVTKCVGSAQIWDIPSLKPIGDPLRRADDGLFSIAYSPDGRTLLTGGLDKTARLWDASNGMMIREPIWHTDLVGQVAYGPDGATLATTTSQEGGQKAAAWLWAGPRPIPDHLLKLAASTRISMTMNDAGQIESLSEVDRSKAWKELESRGADWLTEQKRLDDRRTTGWHHYEATEAENRGDWFAAEFHLRWLLKSEPNELDLKQRHENAKQAFAAASRAPATGVGGRRPVMEEAPRPYRIDDAIECEEMKIVTTSADTRAEPQSGVICSNGAQLLVFGNKPGDFVELAIPAPDAGARKLVLHVTKSYDFGILRFTVNGQPAGKDYDAYSPVVGSPYPIRLGTFSPKDGQFILRVEVVGSNPNSKGAKSYFGLDAVTLGPP